MAGVESLTCEVCGKELLPKAHISAQGMLSFHMKTHRNDHRKKAYADLPVVNTYICDICGFETYDKGGYRLGKGQMGIHKRRKHGGVDIRSSEIVIRTRQPVFVGINGKTYRGVEFTVKGSQYRDIERLLNSRYGSGIIVSRYDKA